MYYKLEYEEINKIFEINTQVLKSFFVPRIDDKMTSVLV